MVIETILFYDELDLLELKLREHYPHFDKFVITEADRTFANKPKPLFYSENKDRFSWAEDKIIHCPIFDLLTADGRWEAENDQRTRGIVAANPSKDDIVFDMCVDEILRHGAIHQTKIALSNHPVVTFNFRLHMYYMDLVSSAYAHWAVACRASEYVVLGGKYKPQEMHWARNQFPVIPNAGWHFTSLGGKEKVVQKLESFSHAEFDTPQMKESIEKLIGGGVVFWDPKLKLRKLSPSEDLPQTVLEHPEIFQHYFMEKA